MINPTAELIFSEKRPTPKMTKPPASHNGFDSILALAFGDGDGAYAWRKEALPVVLETLAAEGLAVAGGENLGDQGFCDLSGHANPNGSHPDIRLECSG